jgi:hypothetical protein
MDDQTKLKIMQKYVANIGITASALRGLGVGGFVQAARDFLANLDLRPLKTLEPSVYPTWLDDQTDVLKKKFPQDLWGPARKSINIFMTMASLNRFLCHAYALERLEDVLEVPLDSVVVSKLQEVEKTLKLFGESGSPRWRSIKALDPANSEKFQKVATAMAKERGISRGALDVALWGPVRN